MKGILVLLSVAAFLVFSCGCTEASPSSPATQSATPVPTPVVKTTKPTPATPRPTYTVVTEATTASVSDNTITIMDRRLSQANITVKAGATVRWWNGDDNTPHRIQFDDRQFTAFLISSGQSFSQKFSRPGIYPYRCLVHPVEQGTVTVV